MSNYEATDESVENAPAPRRSFFDRFRADPLLPEAGAGGAPLTAVIAVMSFLAVMSMAALLIINQSAARWTAELKAEATVQVKGASAAEIADNAARIAGLLRATPGVTEVTQRTPEEAAALLKPWLGGGNVSAFLAVPAIIEIKMTPQLRNDMERLRATIANAAPGAVLDDHAGWHGRLATAARSGQALAFAIFLLVLAAACAISAFAARAGLAANQEIVSVLHLVGATDDFIAAEVQRRFFALGFRGSMVGLVAALIALGLLSMATNSSVANQMFMPQFALGRWLALWLFTVPLITCLVTAITARLAVLRALQSEL